jgi:quercetin dioxygenase-like cupin family protein
LETWDVNSLDVEPHQPQVLQSDEEGRTIAINLPAGEELQEHQVHERAWIVVVDGEVEIEDANGSGVRGGPGTLALAAPNERHEVRAISDARILLVLAPWPGEGHPSQRERA